MARCAGLLWIVTLLAMPLPAVYGDEAYGDDEGVEVATEGQTDAEATVETGGEAQVGDDGERAGRDPSHRELPRQGGAARSRSARLLESFREEMIRALDLDEETTEQIREVFEEHIRTLNEGAARMAADRRGQASEIRELVAELREAQRDGDPERVDELRDQITESRKAQRGEDVPFDELVEELTELLHEEQLEDFARIAKKYETKLSRGKKRRNDRWQVIRKALAGINLSPEQRDATRAIFAELKRDMREARGDEEKSAAVAEELRSALEDELDEEQAAQFAERLAKLERAGDTKAKAARPVTPDALDDEGVVDEEAEDDPADMIDEDPYDDPAPPE